MRCDVSKRPTPNSPGAAVSGTLVELRCSRVAIEIDRIRRLLSVAAGALLAEEDDFELPEEALREVIEIAESRLGAVSESLDCVRLKAEPTKEERERVASNEAIMREIAEGKAQRVRGDAGVPHG